MKSLVGMYTIMNVGHSIYRTGQVIDQVSDNHYLVQYDDMSKSQVEMPMEIISLSEFTDRMACIACGERAWEFFETPEKMNAYIEYNTEPDETETTERSVVTEFPGNTKPKLN